MSCHRITFEFAPQRRRFSRSAGALFAVAAIVFTASATYAVRKLYANSLQERTLTELSIHSNAAPKPVKRAAPVDSAEAARVRAARQTSRILSTPWPRLLAALEDAPANVGLLAVDPSAAKRSISLTAEAANPSDMLNYLQALQGDARLSNVSLVSHHVQLQSPGTPVRFQLKAEWGDAP